MSENKNQSCRLQTELSKGILAAPCFKMQHILLSPSFTYIQVLSLQRKSELAPTIWNGQLLGEVTWSSLLLSLQRHIQHSLGQVEKKVGAASAAPVGILYYF